MRAGETGVACESESDESGDEDDEAEEEEDGGNEERTPLTH